MKFIVWNWGRRMLIEYHRNMLADKPRNEAFYRALDSVIEKGKTTVADIGSGTGLLGFMARKLGARDVYLYEQASIIALSRELARRNKIDHCHFFPGPSAEVMDPPKVDVVVAEILGNFAFEENMIATLDDARRFLKPGGRIIPGKVEQWMAPVTSPRFYNELTVWDGVGFGLDFNLAKTMSLNNAYVRGFKASELLDSGETAVAWDHIDFHKKNKSHRQGTGEWKLSGAETIYGLAVWWMAELVPGVDLSTSPLAPKTHWEQLYFPVERPIEAKKGDIISASIASTSSYEAGTSMKWKLALKRAGKTLSRQSMDLDKGYLP